MPPKFQGKHKHSFSQDGPVMNFAKLKCFVNGQANIKKSAWGGPSPSPIHSSRSGATSRLSNKHLSSKNSILQLQCNMFEPIDSGRRTRQMRQNGETSSQDLMSPSSTKKKSQNVSPTQGDVISCSLVPCTLDKIETPPPTDISRN